MGVLIGVLSATVFLPTAGQSQEPAATPKAASVGPYRRLAPGVMITIKPEQQIAESFSRDDVHELLAIDPNLYVAKNVTFRRDIWALDIQFKPMRVIYVDIPQPSGKMQRKQIWYLVYAVTNPGKTLHPVEVQKGTPEDGNYEASYLDKPVNYVPEFVLESWKESDPKFHKYYPDRVIPAAIAAIQQREDPKRHLCSTVEMAREIQPNETVWGVATWMDIDPRIDRFSIYCYGLTNAYVWKDEPGRIKAGVSPGQRVAAGRTWYRKALKLNFWRPGNAEVKEVEIRYGIPGEPDYVWLDAKQDPLPHSVSGG